MPEATDIASRVEGVYRAIQRTRMEGVPILNPRLEVEAIGFGAYEGVWLGVLVTPWLINLMLVADDAEASLVWTPQVPGTTIPHRLPAGAFDFLVGEDADLGRYRMCSLLSPVLEIEDQAAARLFAETALAAVLDAGLAEEGEDIAEPPATVEPRQLTRRNLLTPAPRREGLA